MDELTQHTLRAAGNSAGSIDEFGRGDIAWRSHARGGTGRGSIETDKA